VSHFGTLIARLEQAGTLPDILGTSFDSFEAIRMLARQCENQDPDLLAAFMTAAAAAADAMDAISFAESLPPGDESELAVALPSACTGCEEAADSIAGLALTLARGLERAGAYATNQRDLLACQDAARAAWQIHQIMAPADARHVR
jgi:hypothetical protein